MRIFDGRKAFSQWDSNVKITADNFKVGDELHFHNGTAKNALVLIAYQFGNAVVVNVPNIFLTTAYPVNVYRYLETADGSYTIEKESFEVNRRPKPDDYVYTETEVLNYSALDKRITALEKNQGGGGGGSGENGATFTPYVSPEGVISWTNDKGLPNPEAVNIKGANGKTPQKGVDYWTEADKSEIKSYVDEAILGGEW